MAWVETHVGSQPAARALADAVLEKRLAACANFAAIESAYWWKGAIQREGEVRVTLTTAPRKLAALVRAVKRAHPYEVPYISWGDDLQVPAGYAAWAATETAAGQGREGNRPPARSRRTR